MMPGTIVDVWEEDVRKSVEARYQAERKRKNMNMDCSVGRNFQQRTTLRLIADGMQDMEYFSPCEVSGLLARGWIKRTEIPEGGGYYFEITPDGEAELERNPA